MGEAIDRIDFSDSDRAEFKRRLREETKILKKMFDQRQFEYRDTPYIGLEVEAWLVDKDFIPNPINESFLKTSNNEYIVEELSQFNFEINVEPELFQGNCFNKLHTNLNKTWEHSIYAAKELNSSPTLIGIHPLIRDQLLQPEYMSKRNRYKALNNEIFKLRKSDSLKFDIQGKEHFQLEVNHIMPEAAATSIQVHLQDNQEHIRRSFNASLMASIPCVALAANSPYLYGFDLWDETRIPLFEQAININSFRDKKGADIGRVTFGTGYIKHSFLELFLENLDGYEPLIPILFDEPLEHLRHLRLHNGTLWRWNRPIIGFTNKQEPHLRTEQRVMASGPTITDIVANMAFYLGLTHYYAKQEKPPEESMTFTDCTNNFYSAAKDGFRARVKWFGSESNLGKLLLEDLIPKAKKGLYHVGIDNGVVEHYLGDIIYHRVLSGQNGANWQRSFINIHGKDFQALSEMYLENQVDGKPVHLWKV